MASGNPRTSALLHLLAHAEGPLTATALARSVSVSERTIKADVPALRSRAAEAGAALRTQRGRGFWLDVMDPELFAAAVEQLDIRAAFRGFGGPASRARVTEVLARLLLASGPTTLDLIADEMFISRSALRPDLRTVRAVLAGFGLELDSRPGFGVAIGGTEFARRLCLVHLFESAFHRAEITLAQGVSPLDPVEYGELRQELLRELRASPVRVQDLRTQRLAQYVALAAARIRGGHQVAHDPRWEPLLAGTAHLAVARQVMSQLAERTGAAVDAGEEWGLAMLLLMWTDVAGEAERGDPNGVLIEEARRHAAAIDQDLVESLGVALFRQSGARSALVAGILPVLVRLRAGLGAAQFQLGAQAYTDEAASPVALAIARRAATVLSPSTPLAPDAIIDLAACITATLDSVQRRFRGRRVALCGRGLDGARQLRNQILDRYPRDRYFAALDMFELYELRGVDQSAYDAVIFDGAAVGYRYDWPVVRFGRPISAEDLQRFQDVVIAPGFEFSGMLGALGLERLAVFGNVTASSIRGLAATIGFRLGGDPTSAARVESAVFDAYATSVYGPTCAIVIPRVDLTRNQIEVYELATPISGVSVDVTHVVVCAIDFGGDDQAVRLVDDIMTQLVHDPIAARAAMVAGELGPLVAAVAARAR